MSDAVKTLDLPRVDRVALTMAQGDALYRKLLYNIDTPSLCSISLFNVPLASRISRSSARCHAIRVKLKSAGFAHSPRSLEVGYEL